VVKLIHKYFYIVFSLLVGLDLLVIASVTLWPFNPLTHCVYYLLIASQLVFCGRPTLQLHCKCRYCHKMLSVCLSVVVCLPRECIVTKRLKLGLYRLAILKTEFEGGLFERGLNLCCCGLRLRRTVDSLLHVTCLHMTSYCFRRARDRRAINNRVDGSSRRMKWVETSEVGLGYKPTDIQCQVQYSNRFDTTTVTLRRIDA